MIPIMMMIALAMVMVMMMVTDDVYDADNDSVLKVSSKSNLFNLAIFANKFFSLLDILL